MTDKGDSKSCHPERSKGAGGRHHLPPHLGATAAYLQRAARMEAAGRNPGITPHTAMAPRHPRIPLRCIRAARLTQTSVGRGFDGMLAFGRSRGNVKDASAAA